VDIIERDGSEQFIYPSTEIREKPFCARIDRLTREVCEARSKIGYGVLTLL
jgi:hypothetical protein